MVALYVGGNKVGTFDLKPELIAARSQSVELRTDDGDLLGTFIPKSEPICPWEPTLTREEADRRCAGPKTKLDEIFKRLGAE